MATTTIISETRTVDTTKTEFNLWDRVIATADSLPLFVARLGLGIMILPHGLQKTFGLFGGFGFNGTMGYFQQQGIPMVFAFLAIMAEFLGGLGLLTGFLARIAAFGVFCNMLVATLMVHLPNGFFMNWNGNQTGEGFEFHILAMALALATMIGGAGSWSIDRAFFTRRHRDIL